MIRSIPISIAFFFVLACSEADDPAHDDGSGFASGAAGAVGSTGSAASGGGSAQGGAGVGGTGGGGASGGSFDGSEYRQNTYGVPNVYCDPTRSLSSDGTGTLADPYNLTQCAASPVAGDVVGILPSGDNAVQLATTSSDDFPAFHPAQSGTADQRIVYVTKYAAVALPDLWNNPDRTELRTNATPPQIVDGLGVANGCATYGTSSRDYITFDGIALDMAQAWIADDTGMISARSSTGTHFKNFVLRGAVTTCGSNCVMYRPDNAVDTVLSNFRAYDFDNDPTGSATPQQALFSDQYGDRNSVIEHFEISNTERGIFYKGTAPPGVNFNYGTIRYGIVRDVYECFRFNDLDPTQATTVHHNVCHDFGYDGIGLSSETSDPRNIVFHNNTIANGSGASINFAGPVYIKQAETMSNVALRDNIFDLLDGGFGHGVDAGELNGPFPMMNHNGYYKNGAALTWSYDGAEASTMAAWVEATGNEANSSVVRSDPFIDRRADDYSLAPGHPAWTASSTGGPIGAFDGTGPIGVVID